MNVCHPKRVLAFIVALALLLELGPLSGATSRANSGSLLDGTIPSSRAHAEQSPTLLTNITFLPLVAHNTLVQTVFGFETFALMDGGGLAEMSAAKASWVRRNGINWSDVETVPGVRNWTVLAGLEQEMINASSNGMQMIAIVRGTPAWAQAVTGSSCGAILPTKLSAFGSFMHDLVARYSRPPFYVRYWEIWNEPDVDPTGMPINSNYGCWGDNNDAYYGGGYFAQMLQTIYPQIKASDSGAQVLIGGLLLDCPATTSTCASGSRASKFLEGILRAGGGAYFDGVAFHAYDYYGGALGHYQNPNWIGNWNTTGPVLIPKARFVKQQLQAYGVTGKQLFGTETALLCICATTDDTFELTKAYYVTQSFASAMAEGLRMSSWYAYYGWRQSGLASSSPPWGMLPSYTAFQVARRELGDAQFSNEISSFPGIKGYAFTRRGHRLWLLWSLDGANHLVSLPSTPTSVQNPLGNPISVATNTIAVSIVPLLIELP